jgi:hypothetical protein
MKRALVMVGVMVFSSPALADPNPTLGGAGVTIAVITTAAATTKHASTSRNFTEGLARSSANGSAMASTKKRRSAKATANAVEAASVRRPHLFRVITRCAENSDLW